MNVPAKERIKATLAGTDESRLTGILAANAAAAREGKRTFVYDGITVVTTPPGMTLPAPKGFYEESEPDDPDHIESSDGLCLCGLHSIEQCYHAKRDAGGQISNCCYWPPRNPDIPQNAAAIYRIDRRKRR